MSKQSTGTVRILMNDHHQPQWHAKWTLADGSRGPWTGIDPSIPAVETPENRAAARAYAARKAPAVRKVSAGQPAIETLEEFSQRWLSDREERIKSIRSDRGRLPQHVYSIIGSLDVCAFGREDVERLRDDLDAKIVQGAISWKTAAKVWTVVTSMADDMVNSKRRALRVRADNPCKDVRPPERGARKAKQFLYPSEFLTFASYEAIPLRWRCALTVATYTYARDGELRELRWDGGDVDLEHGVLSITRAYNQSTKKVEATKTVHTRRFAVELSLMPLLEAMHDEAGGKGHVLSLAPQGNMARKLRMYLKRAGVTRVELHEGSPTRKPMTWHDLRATGAYVDGRARR